jgi:hypothetical protein
MMVSYIVALWARLLVNYGANLKELWYDRRWFLYR